MHERILVIKLGALGDVVMATALVARIRAHHGDAELTLLTTDRFAGIFAGWERLRIETRPRRGLRATARTVAWLRQCRFARIYDLQSNDRTGLWCALSGAGIRVGNHARFPYTHHPPTPWRGQCHVFTRMNAVLAAGGVAAAAPRPLLPASAGERTRVADWLAAHALAARGFAVLHAGASARRLLEKSWPHYRALGAAFAGAGVTPVWIGAGADGPGNRELAAAAGIDATDAFSILELAELGRHAAFAVTNDSGPMHVLAASDIPVYAFFGASDWRRNHALGQGQRVFASPDLSAITVAMVLARLERDGLLGG
ncbi:MAG: glycosyltransferase family 9 protein [Gammaproteobacteria bacterium]|nr:glycosyltransferase family 9 protein [Gammaproteobacteria bacterium]